LQTAIRKVAPTPPRIVNFNAWRHDKEDALWAAFALSFIEQVTAQLPWRQNLVGWARLFWKRFTWSEGWSQAARAMFLSLTILACALLIPILMFVRGQTWAESLALQLEKIGTHSEQSSKSGNPHSTPIPSDDVPSNDKAPVIRNALPPLIKAGGWTGSLALFLFLLYSITRILGNPLKINLRKYVRSPDYEGKTAFIENFHRDFKRILDAYIGSAREGDTGEIANKLKTFIFIDDLDRCDVPKAAELMSAINLMISDDERLMFIIGMDRQKVAAGVAWKYKDLVQFLQERTASAITDSQLARDRLRFGYEFLEKFIQLPFKLPAPSEDSLKDFLQKVSQQGTALARQRKDNVETASLRAQRQQVLLNIEHDSEIVGAMSLLIASTFDQNPRRMKQFVNLFRLKLYLASSTGLLDKPDVTPEQLGKLTAILLRWPDFMDAWLAKRELLGDLEHYAMSLKADQGKRNVNAAGWFLEEDLLQLLQIVAFRTTAMDPAYSLQNVDVDKVLRVMPVPGKNGEPPHPRPLPHQG
jgi:KAP family P-loop domain